MNLEDIKALISKKQEELDDTIKTMVRINEELDRLRLDKLKLEHGVEVGSIVQHRGEDYKVAAIKELHYNKPWIQGSPRKKDGSWSKAIRDLFDYWTVEKP